MAVYGPSLAVEDYAELVGFLLGALAFIVLIGLDLRNAIKKGAHWVPGRALVLSALTIQIMNFVENQSGLLDEILEGSEPWNNEIVKNNLFMIHTSRVMLCVLVAYFLPGMARPGSEEKWTKIAAIGLTVFIDIFSELNSARSHLANSPRSRLPTSSKRSSFFYSWPEDKSVSQVSFFVSGAIISITLIWLILLLICAAIASKSIRNITTQKIPIILAEPAENSWKGVEDQVLKSWIVARSCYTESIVARSALASSAALGVTICILSSILGWIVQGPKVRFHRNPAFWLKFIITILEVIFILIGWAIIGFRWITSVAYYGRKRIPNQECCKYFEVEDYWTRHIVDLQEAENLKLRELKVDERISKMFVMKLRKLHVHERVSKMIAKERKRRTSFVSMWLKFVFRLQYCVVFFSKVCWFLSDLTFGSEFMRKIVSKILSKRSKKMKTEFEEYNAIWNSLEVLWDQTAHTLFVTNRKSIKQARLIMNKGNKDGENCHALIPFLANWRSETCVCLSDLDPDDPDKRAATGLKFLWKGYDHVNPLPVEKYFKYASKRSWKLTAVSLISIIVQLSPHRGRDSLQAYYEAWELIDLVDESDPATDKLLSKAADRLFTSVRDPSENVAPTTMEKARDQSKNKAPTTIEEAATAIDDLAKECQAKSEAIGQKIVDRKDTMEDWEELAARNAVYKLCKSMVCTSGNCENVLDELQRSLAIIISSCIKKVGPALVNTTRKWAQDLDKIKLLEAVYIAGKSRGLMGKLGWGPDAASSAEVSHHGWSKNVVNAQVTDESSMV